MRRVREIHDAEQQVARLEHREPNKGRKQLVEKLKKEIQRGRDR